MKRAIYLLAATALMASCTQSEVLVDTPNPVPEVPRSIGFDTFVDKATRATGENSTALNDFYPAFNVYGWKTVGNEKPTPIFNNITVSYYNAEEGKGVKPSIEWGEAPATGWYYNEIRYWDKMASGYKFSAYAPVQASKDVTCTPDGIIKIGQETAPITVETTNLMAKPAVTLAYTGFKYDYMTATSGESLDKVSLNFQHLLAKLNIRIRLSNVITTAQDISIQKIQVHNLGCYGYYTSDENETGTVTGWKRPNITDIVDKYIPSVEKAYSLNAAGGNFHNHYVLEQLIIPQTITASAAATTSLSEYPEACIYVEYTIGKEKFKSFSPLANIFIGKGAATAYNFEGGKQYTLNITVGPAPIEFEATVTEWAKEIEAEHKMD